MAERLAVALLGADPRVGRDWQGRWHLADTQRGSPALADCTFSVVDVETTGSCAGRGDRITEIAVVLLQGSKAETVVDRLVNPGRPIPAAVTRITRITDAMVRNEATFPEVADEVLAALAGRIFVAHNAAFDWRFVAAEIRRAKDLRLDGPRLCTVKMARRLIPGLKHRGLDSVARYLGIEIQGRHRAGGDARATAAVLTRLLEAAQESGAMTLRELTDTLSRPRTRKRKRRLGGPTWMEEI